MRLLALLASILLCSSAIGASNGTDVNFFLFQREGKICVLTDELPILLPADPMRLGAMAYLTTIRLGFNEHSEWEHSSVVTLEFAPGRMRLVWEIDVVGPGMLNLELIQDKDGLNVRNWQTAPGGFDVTKTYADYPAFIRSGDKSVGLAHLLIDRLIGNPVIPDVQTLRCFAFDIEPGSDAKTDQEIRALVELAGNDEWDVRIRATNALMQDKYAPHLRRVTAGVDLTPEQHKNVECVLARRRYKIAANLVPLLRKEVGAEEKAIVSPAMVVIQPRMNR